MQNTLLKTIMIAAFSVSLIACASSTQIKSDPGGADLYIDGEKVGKTPYTYTDTRIVGSVVHAKMKKEGFEDLDVSFNRSEEPDVGAIVGGVFALVPFLWTMKYKPVHSYEMVATHHQDVAPVPEYQQSITPQKTKRKSKKN